MNRVWVLSVLGAALIAGCGTSKAEENAKSAKTRFAAGQPCAATTLEPTEPAYRTACEAQQRKEKAEREQAEKREARERKANEKREQAEEAKTKREEVKTKREEEKTTEAKPEEHTSTPEGGGHKVPGNLVGKTLPQAESELEGSGIQFSHETINGDAVILGGDWGVCSTTPSAGEPVTGAIVLHLGHFQCGA
jgi:TolA-binding protein